MIEHTSNYDEDKVITAKQQVMFAIQVAYGLVSFQKIYINQDSHFRNT